MPVNEKNLLEKMLNWELCFDQEQIPNKKVEASDSKLLEIILAANSGDHATVLELCDQLFKEASNELLLQVFAIQWAVAATESIYDMNLRAQWVARWSQIRSWKHNFWAQFLFNTQKAIGYFYEGALHECQAYFKICLEIAMTENYERGTYRTLFNLGMIEKDRLNYGKSKEYLEQALIIAENNQSKRMIQKIESALKHLQSKTAYHQEMERVLGFLTLGKKQEARAFIRKLFMLRKLEGVAPEKNSDYLLMAIYYYNIKKMKSFDIVISHIADPILKFHCYNICSQMDELPLQNQYEFELLKKYFDPNSLIETHTPHSNAPSIKYSIDSNKLLNLLKNHPNGLSKEEIARILWKQQYDPLYHDSKIYKLVLKCRKEAKNPKILINKYGFYRIGS